MFKLSPTLKFAAITILLACLTHQRSAWADRTESERSFSTGEELCAVKSNVFGKYHPLALGLESDVTEEKCAEWNRVAILVDHVEYNGGALKREDEGVARFKTEGRNVFCHYHVDKGAKPLPAEAVRWIRTPKDRATNWKTTPDYAILREYAAETIVFECQDLGS